MITRHSSNGRFSKLVIANGFAFLSGMTAIDRTGDITAQTRDVLAQIDTYLEMAGTSKSNMVSVNIWLLHITDIDAMNKVWMEWIPAGAEPARATVESKLASPDMLVEIMAQALI